MCRELLVQQAHFSGRSERLNQFRLRRFKRSGRLQRMSEIDFFLFIHMACVCARSRKKEIEREIEA